jgi:hypothetical protein
MKEMGETIFPSYKVGLFLVELPCGTWQALEKDSDVYGVAYMSFSNTSSWQLR